MSLIMWVSVVTSEILENEHHYLDRDPECPFLDMEHPIKDGG